jgi:hypothetical protein
VKEEPTMIAKADCKHRQLYRIHSRNLLIGVYNEPTGGFLGLRTKFGHVYVFEEYHWENEAFATVQPKEELPERLPDEIEPTEDLGTYCRACKADIKYVRFPDGEREITLKTGGTMMVPGSLVHPEGNPCQEILATNKYNQPLEDWLHEMEKKYVKEGEPR